MKLSIIIPMYNTSKWCEPLIKALTIQQKTYKETEIILIDDGSTEDTTWVEQYPSVVFMQKPNGGVSSARNAGLAKATGDYVVFVDSDDYVYDDYLETIYKEIGGHDILVYRNNVYNAPMVWFPGLYPTYALWSYVFKRSLFDGITFDESLRYGEDIAVLRKVMKPNSDYKRIMKRIYLYNFCVNPESINNLIKAGKL